MYQKIFKRWIDVSFSIIAILLLSPLFLLVALSVWISLGRPVFFTQKRAGKNGEVFVIHKFRSMKNQHDNNGVLLSDEKRLTKFGRFLRESSLDELPEFFDVLRGKMSLVGPRPYLPEYVVLYDDYQRRRLNVKPGITGWQQIKGRNKLAWKDKFPYDIWYEENISFCLDIKILILTLPVVFKRDGINEVGHATSSRFTGNNIINQGLIKEEQL